MYVILHVIGLWVDTNSTPWSVALLVCCHKICHLQKLWNFKEEVITFFFLIFFSILWGYNLNVSICTISLLNFTGLLLGWVAIEVVWNLRSGIKKFYCNFCCEKWVKFKFEIAVSLLANMYITMDRNAKVAMEVFQKCPGLRSSWHSVCMTLC